MNFSNVCSFAMFGAAVLASTGVLSAKPLDVAMETREKVSKGVGHLRGQEFLTSLKTNGYEVSDFTTAELLEGFRLALEEKDAGVSQEDFQVAMNLMQAKLQERELGLAKKNRASSAEWLSENGKKEGVETTESGLQYEVVKKGEGEVFSKLSEEEQEKVEAFLIRYQSANKDGVVFERSPEDQLVAVKDKLLPGLAEAVRAMPAGSVWKLYLHPDLGYGNRRVGAAMEPGSVVVLEVFLAETSKAKK
ncbi:FKBP-type peptidyl-prolyl cis-trans isomerase N-terminal domain-containing protein [Luteolibacter sp. AS25]|uniref:FKBP-type peptidyl-prolyl cis-trans isomerase N-terminal domain-containing protein n=1 Tax=Luteolibacter sp. AS25 TaxID=3135776 RepID=UPI00398B970E